VRGGRAVLHGAVHIVVVGCGRVGSGLACRLVELGHSVAIVDKNPSAFRRLPESWPGTSVVGSGFDRHDLERAGAPRAGALAAVTSGDNSNILTARIARETYGIANVVARIYDPRRAQVYQRLGIPTVATVPWTIDKVLERLLPETVVGEWSDTTGRMVLAERLIPEAWAGRRLAPLNEPGSISLVAVTRAGTPRLDVTDLVGQEGDVLHFLLLKQAAGTLEERLAGPDGAWPSPAGRPSTTSGPAPAAPGSTADPAATGERP
jgi:trk system potassium uptake protein TrkA